MFPSDEDDLLPELPPLLDDGEAVEETETGVEFDESEAGGGWEEATSADLDVALLIAGDEDEDDVSWLGDDEAGALDDEEALLEEPEYGFLDDSPSDTFADDLDADEEETLVGDTGEEGTDDPISPVTDDEDSVDLPPLASDDSGDDEEEDVDDDDVLSDDEESIPRTHHGLV